MPASIKAPRQPQEDLHRRMSIGLKITSLDGSARKLDGDAIKQLQQTLSIRLLRSSDDGFVGARSIWNGGHDIHPGLIARCTGAADVMDIVKFARSHELLISIRGGGHNVAGTALCNGGLVIDLSQMRG